MESRHEDTDITGRDSTVLYASVCCRHWPHRTCYVVALMRNFIRITLLALLLSSCDGTLQVIKDRGVRTGNTFITTWDHGVMVVYPSPKQRIKESMPEFCYKFYNVEKHRQWAECMGVGYVEAN